MKNIHNAKNQPNNRENGLGYLIAEKWYDNNENLTHYFKYVYDGQGNIVRSIDILALKEYNYIYENGRLIRSAESDIVINSDEFVTSKNLVCSVYYFYNSEDSLSKKVTTFADGSEQVTLFEQAENGSEISKTTVGGKTVTSISKTDNFGRKVFDELQLGTGFVSRQFSYHAGEVTDEHSNNKMLKSSPTTQLVSGITLSDGRTILYEYDAEERITKVIDSEDGVTEYTYDALGQLLTETVNGEVVNSMVYDNYGNILQKNGKQYVYDEVWKDKLSYYDGEYITYDAQGNPLNYLGHTLTWEKGRQLKSLDNIQYEYNANGIRTSKTIDGTRHDFYLDGAKILKECWDDKTLDVLYDNEDTVCGIIYNGTPYFFLKNLQGDIIAITNVEGETVANYRYDAWGKCEIVAGSNPIADVNPFRYRGYYYDKETGHYYLQSRYYDPEMGRFLNGDDAEFATISQSIVDHNLYAYCGNNVIMRKDSYGYKYRYISTDWVSIPLDIILATFYPYVAGVYDVWGIVLKSFYKRFGLTKVANRILTWLFPKVTGLFSSVWRALDWLAKKVLKVSVSIFENKAIGWVLNRFAKILKGRGKELYYLVISLFSTGSCFAGFFDYLTDFKFDGRIRIGY